MNMLTNLYNLKMNIIEMIGIFVEQKGGNQTAGKIHGDHYHQHQKILGNEFLTGKQESATGGHHQIDGRAAEHQENGIAIAGVDIPPLEYHFIGFRGEAIRGQQKPRMGLQKQRIAEGAVDNMDEGIEAGGCDQNEKKAVDDAESPVAAGDFHLNSSLPKAVAA